MDWVRAWVPLPRGPDTGAAGTPREASYDSAPTILHQPAPGGGRAGRGGACAPQ